MKAYNEYTSEELRELLMNLLAQYKEYQAKEKENKYLYEIL